MTPVSSPADGVAEVPVGGGVVSVLGVESVVTDETSMLGASVSSEGFVELGGPFVWKMVFVMHFGPVSAGSGSGVCGEAESLPALEATILDVRIVLVIVVVYVVVIVIVTSSQSSGSSLRSRYPPCSRSRSES